MNDSQKKKFWLKIRVSKDEMECINRKFKNSGYKSKSEFVRTMIFSGYILHFDEQKIQKLFDLTLNISNNINQIAVRVNSTDNFYDEDMAEIKEEVREIWLLQKSFQSSLQKRDVKEQKHKRNGDLG